MTAQLHSAFQARQQLQINNIFIHIFNAAKRLIPSINSPASTTFSDIAIQYREKVFPDFVVMITAARRSVDLDSILMCARVLNFQGNNNILSSQLMGSITQLYSWVQPQSTTLLQTEGFMWIAHCVIMQVHSHSLAQSTVQNTMVSSMYLAACRLCGSFFESLTDTQATTSLMTQSLAVMGTTLPSLWLLEKVPQSIAAQTGPEVAKLAIVAIAHCQNPDVPATDAVRFFLLRNAETLLNMNSSWSYISVR